MNLIEALMLMVLGFSLAAPLGPINMEMIKQALSRNKGWILSIMIGVGAMTGDFIIAFTSMTLGEEFLKNIIGNSLIKLFLFLFNSLILSYIGISGLKTKISENDSEIKITKKDIESNTRQDQFLMKLIPAQYGKGFLIVVTSPWSYLWWLSFGSYLLSSGIELKTVSQRILATILFLTGIFTWVILFSGTLGISQKAASPKVLNIITKTSAGIILLFAIKIAYDAIKIILELFFNNS